MIQKRDGLERLLEEMPRRDGDVWKNRAAAMFGVNYEDVTDEQRSEAKRRYHMMAYNASDVQLAMDMEAWRVSRQSRWERFCEWVSRMFDNLFYWLSR